MPSCEDGDMSYRVLKAGHHVLSGPDSWVMHHGFRDWREGRQLMRGTGIAVGAAYMKHLRLGDLAILPTLVYEWLICLSWRRLALLRPRSGVARFGAYALGMVRSFGYQVDCVSRTYKRRPGKDSFGQTEAGSTAQRAI
jgi:hypothetical protein